MLAQVLGEIKKLGERVGKIEEKLGLVVKDLEIKKGEAEDTQVSFPRLDKGKVSEVVVSELKLTESRLEGKIGEIGKAVEGLVAKTEASKISEQWTQVVSRRSERRSSKVAESSKLSFSEKFKDKAKDTLMLVGDSLARGVGERLVQQSNMASKLSIGGARIEKISEEIEKLKDSDGRHLVLLVGTNNLKAEGSELILRKFKAMMDVCKKRISRKVTVVGIPRRADLTSYEQSKRVGINLRLKDMCTENKFEFFDYEPQRSRLARDGLHFNALGQDELGREIFRHCRSFLV